MRSSLFYCATLAFASTVAVAELNVEHYPSKKAIVRDLDSKWINTFWHDEYYKIAYPKELEPVVYEKDVDPCEQHHKRRNPNAECDHKIDSEHRECENKEHWAVTIEEGPNGNSQNYIDALYEVGDVKAIFFVVGHRLLEPEYAKVLIKIVEAGHEIGISAWSHKRLSTLTDEQIVAEIKWTEKAIKEVTGQYPSNYVRPPFGNMDMRVLRIIEELGYKVVLYNADPEDHEFDEKRDNQHDRREVLQTIKSRFHKYIEGSKKEHRGTISLHHSVGKVPTLVAKDVLEYIRGGENAEWRNTFVPMSVCLNEKYAHAHKNEAAHEEVVDRREIKIVRTNVDHTGTPAQKAGDDESKTELTFAHFKDVKNTNADHTGTSGYKPADAEPGTEFSFAHKKVVADNNADHTKTSERKHEDDDSTAGLTFAPHTGPKRMTPEHEAEEADEKTESRTEITFIHTRTEEEDKPKGATDDHGRTH